MRYNEQEAEELRQIYISNDATSSYRPLDSADTARSSLADILFNKKVANDKELYHKVVKAFVIVDEVYKELGGKFI